MNTKHQQAERRKAIEKDRTRAALNSVLEDARAARVCRNNACHSRDDVRSVIGADGEPVVLCAHCRRMYLPIAGGA